MPIYLFFLILSFPSFALDLDEKLSSQIINVSQSRKTVITKRGLDDGIRLGDHAKLFDKEGMFAWGVAIKMSPNRTIWLLYKIPNIEKLVPGYKMGLKISAPALGQEKLGLKLENLDKKQEKQLQVSSREKKLSLGSPPFPFDLIGQLAMTSHSFSDDKEVSSAYNQSGHKTKGNRFLIGVSYPFSRFSVLASLGYSWDESEKSAGHRTETKNTEVQLGMEYNFSSPPFYEKLFPFIHLGYGLGNTTIERESKTTTGEVATGDLESQKGRSKLTFFGMGLKKVYSSHLGLRLSLDYLIKKEFFSLREDGQYTRRTKKGAQFALGVFYQFR